MEIAFLYQENTFCSSGISGPTIKVRRAPLVAIRWNLAYQAALPSLLSFLLPLSGAGSKKEQNQCNIQIQEPNSSSHALHHLVFKARTAMSEAWHLISQSLKGWTTLWQTHQILKISLSGIFITQGVFNDIIQ